MYLLLFCFKGSNTQWTLWNVESICTCLSTALQKGYHQGGVFGSWPKADVIFCNVLKPFAGRRSAHQTCIFMAILKIAYLIMDLFSLFGASHLRGTRELWEITIKTMLIFVGIKLFSTKFKKRKINSFKLAFPFLTFW